MRTLRRAAEGGSEPGFPKERVLTIGGIFVSNEKKNDGKLLDFKDWKVHLLCLIMVVVADGIGSIPVGAGIIKFTLLPMLYALVIGIILAAAKVIKRDMMEIASPYIGISVMFLSVRMGSTIGPNL